MRPETSTPHLVDRELEQKVEGEGVSSGNFFSNSTNFNCASPHGHDSSLVSTYEVDHPHHTASEHTYSDDDEYEYDADGDVDMSDSDGGVSLNYEEGIDEAPDPLPDSWHSAFWSTPATSVSLSPIHTYFYYDPASLVANMTSSNGAEILTPPAAAQAQAPAPATTSMPPPPPHADLVLGVPPFLHISNTPASQGLLSPGQATVANASWYHQSAHVGLFAQHLQEIQDEEDSETITLSDFHPGVLGSQNHPLIPFLKLWARPDRYGRDFSRPRINAPSMLRICHLTGAKPWRVEYDHLLGDKCDFQGIDWEDLGVTRREARERRLNMYKNFVNIAASDDFGAFQSEPTAQPCKGGENYFRFRRMDVRQNVHLAHFQLRNVLASTARNKSYYPGRDAVMRINPISGRTEKVMDTSILSGGPIISTLAASHGLLVAGSFHGEYCIRNLDSESGEQYDGPLSERGSITTHVQVNLGRTSSLPIAAFACNDSQFRLMDIATQKFVLEKTYDDPINCAVLSPDRRLRVMVGDNTKVLITHADTGKVLHVLEGHRDFGFACDWADDGYTVATGCQDMSIKIWDARRWKNSNGDSAPVCTLRTEMSGIRSMRFSPAGSGRKVLVAAEESDIVNIIDARDFSRKQTFDVFGEIGGVAFANEGQHLQVLCCDRDRGGLIQLERWDLAPQPHELAGETTLANSPGRRTRGLRNAEIQLPSRLGIDWQEAADDDEFLRKPTVRYGSSLWDTMAPF